MMVGRGIPRHQTAPRSSWSAVGGAGQQLPVEVCYRMVRLFEEEIEVHRQLKFHRRRLYEQGVRSRDIFLYLKSEQGGPSTALLSPLGLRRLMVDRLRVLLPSQ